MEDRLQCAISLFVFKSFALAIRESYLQVIATIKLYIGYIVVIVKKMCISTLLKCYGISCYFITKRLCQPLWFMPVMCDLCQLCVRFRLSEYLKNWVVSLKIQLL